MRFITTVLWTALALLVAGSASAWTEQENGGNTVSYLGQRGDTAYYKLTATGNSSTLEIKAPDSGVFCVNANVAGTGANSLVLTLDELVGEFDDANHWQAFDNISFTGVYPYTCAIVPPGKYRVNVSDAPASAAVVNMRRIAH